MLKKNEEKVHFNVGTQVSHRSQRVKKERKIYLGMNSSTYSIHLFKYFSFYANLCTNTT